MHYYLRKLRNHFFTTLCFLALTLILIVIASIVWTLLKLGLPALTHLSFFTEITPAPGMQGGLSNAIYGTLIMSGCAIVIASILGIVIALFLSEFSLGSNFQKILEFINDVLLCTPSIIIGLFVYALLVKPTHHFSGIAGIIALFIIALPIIVRTTCDMLKIVPQHLREAALALGAPYWKMISKIILKSVYHGILTGVLLAFARIIGETAPLLFTSFNNQFANHSLNGPLASLPVVIYQYAMSPYLNWQQLAWGGALFITAIVCIISIISKLVLKNNPR